MMSQNRKLELSRIIFAHVAIILAASFGLSQEGGIPNSRVEQMHELCDFLRADYLDDANRAAKVSEPAKVIQRQRAERSATEEIRWITLHATDSQIRKPEGDETVIEKFLNDFESGAKEKNGSYDHAVEWGSIPYHFLVSPNGIVYQGRDVRMRASSGSSYSNPANYLSAKAHGPDGKLRSAFWIPKSERPGYNEGHLTVAFIGNFRDANVTRKNNDLAGTVKIEEYAPTLKAKRAAAKLIANLLSINDLELESVLAHREVSSSSCPGEFAYEILRGNDRRPRGMGELMWTIKWYYDRLEEAEN